jgi:succinate dehydrogenase/fumarate reductase cytochrome b subunit
MVAQSVSERRWQPYRGTVAWVAQRVSAIALFVLVPIKMYSGYGASGKLPWLDSVSGLALHVNMIIDLSLLFFLLVHALFGLRVMLIEGGLLGVERGFWQTAAAAAALFLVAVYVLYIR